jgi:hypothetical protein
MSDAVVVQFKYSAPEYLEAAKFYIAKRYHTRFSMALALLVVVIGLAVRAFDGDTVFGYVFIVLGTLLFLLYCYSYFTSPQRWYQGNPLLREEYRLSFSDEGIGFQTKNVESALQWSLYKEVWETERFYFLLYGKDAFTLIPKRAFADERQKRAFKEMLQKHIGGKFGDQKALEPVQEDEQDYVPKSLEPPDWR